MRSWILIWALPVGLADILCDVRMSERQVMLINTQTGDEKYTASTLEVQCNDVFKRNETTVRNPWKLWLKACKDGMMYDKVGDNCGGCPKDAGDSVKDHFPDAPDHAYWEECQAVETADGMKCSCRYSYTEWTPEGGPQDYRKSGMLSMKVGCSGSEDGCLVYVSSSEAWRTSAVSLKLPSYTCTDLEAFAPAPDIGSAMLTPPVEKDSLFQLLRSTFAEGVLPMSEVVKDWVLKENSVKILFMSRISRSGQDLRVGPSFAELASNCQITPNIYFDEQGTAVNNGQSIPASAIPVYSPLCVAEEVDNMKTFVMNMTDEMKALANNAVLCKNGSDTTTTTSPGGRRLSTKDQVAELLKSWEAAAKEQGRRSTILGAAQMKRQAQFQVARKKALEKKRKLQMDQMHYVVRGDIIFTTTTSCDYLLAPPVEVETEDIFSVFGVLVQAALGEEWEAAADFFQIAPNGCVETATPLVYELTMHYTGDAGSVTQGDDQVQTTWYELIQAAAVETKEYATHAATIGGDYEKLTGMKVGDLTMTAWTVEYGEAAMDGSGGFPPVENGGGYGGNGGDGKVPEDYQDDGGDDGDDGDDYILSEGMDCDRKRQVVQYRTEKLLQHAFVITGKDSWAGCKGFLDSWVVYGTQTKTKTTNKCTVPYEDNLGNLNPKWENDPCCNWMKRQHQCCAPREVEELITVVDDVNEDNIALFSAATGSGTLALDLAMTYASAETEAAKSCFGPYKAFMDATNDVWKVVDECRVAVEGAWSETYQVQLGSKCTSHIDCYTGECYAPVSNNRGGSSGGTKQKYCKTPDEMEVPNWGAATLTCLIDKSIPELKGRLAIRLQLPGKSTAAELAAKFLAEPGMQRAECRGHDNPWNRLTEESCMAPKQCNFDGAVSNETQCLNPCEEGGVSCSSYCGQGDWEVSELPFCLPRVNSDSDPWTACDRIIQNTRQQWEAECFACNDKCMNQEIGEDGQWQDCDCHAADGPCDYWRREEAARRECMDNYCGRYCSGGECASFYRWQCIYPAFSFLSSRKDECLSECSATGGPNPVAPKSCRAILNPSLATEDACWSLGLGHIEVHYAEYSNWDWSLGNPPPESCVVKSFQALNGKPYVPPPPYGHSCLPACEEELDSCLNNPQCWNWIDEEEKSVDMICYEVFEEYAQSFRSCMDEQWNQCSGLGCLRIHRQCQRSTGLADHPTFSDYHCATCWGEWMSHSGQQLHCAESLSVEECRFDTETMSTESQACAPECIWEVCEQAFSECSIHGGSLQECAVNVTEMNQCRGCDLVKCEARCDEGACDATFGGRDEAYRECAGCDSSVQCNPESPCYGDRADSSCNWRWEPEFGYSCPILCEESIRMCQEGVFGFCYEWDDDEGRTRSDKCNEEYDIYRPSMQTCYLENMPTERPAGASWRELEVNTTVACAKKHIPTDWECLKCNGEWNYWNSWAIEYGPKCLDGSISFDNGQTVPSTCSACKPSTCPEYPVSCHSHWEEERTCHFNDYNFKICNRTAAAAKTAVVAKYPQCSDCKAARCEWGCLDNTCANLLMHNAHGDRMVTSEQCGGCPDTAKCHPGAECYIDDTVAYTSADLEDWTTFLTKFQPLMEKFRTCIPGINLRRRLTVAKNGKKALSKPEGTQPEARTSKKKPLQLAPSVKDLEHQVVALWKRGSRLRNQGRNKRQQLQQLTSSTVAQTRLDAVLARRSLLETEHKEILKKYRALKVKHEEVLKKWLDKGGIVSAPPHLELTDFHQEHRTTAGPGTVRRLQEEETVQLSCTTSDCTAQEVSCSAFFNRGEDVTQQLVSSLVKSFSFAELPWENQDQICQNMAEICFMSVDEAATYVLQGDYTNMSAPWVDDWCMPETMSTDCPHDRCTACADDSPLDYNTCDGCCRCYGNVTGYYADIKHNSHSGPGYAKCHMLQKYLMRYGTLEWYDHVGFDEKLLGGEGACTYHIDVWKHIPDECNRYECWMDEACMRRCGTPEATKEMCLKPLTWSFFKSTREWRHGTLATKSTCEVESCYPQPWIQTQEECAKVSHCESDCPYCETMSFWDQTTRKSKVKCSFVNSKNSNPLSSSDCKVACGGAFTDTCYHIKDSKGTGEACITPPPADGQGSTVFDQCVGEKTLSGATVTKASYEVLQCSSFTTEQCGWAEETFGDDMQCNIVRLQCKNKADCANAGRCDYEWDDWQIQENKGFCVAPIDFSGTDAFKPERNIWDCSSMDGGEHRTYGCGLHNQRSKTECEEAGAKWFNWAPNKNKCEVPGYVWKKGSDGKYFSGTMACCIQLRGSQSEGRCEMFTQDENSTACSKCGGTWMSIFKFRSYGNWVEGEWKKNYKWVARAFEPSNRWVSRIAFERVTDVWQNLIATIRTVPATNFVTCRINPTLDTLGAIAKQTSAESNLGVVPLLPATESATQLGDYVITPSESSVTGTAEIDVEVNVVSSGAVVAESAKEDGSTTATTTTGAARRLATTGLSDSLTSSCYTVVMESTRYVGQLVGDCMVFNPSTTLDNPVQVCLPINPQIPVYSAFGADALATHSDSKYTIFPVSVTRSSDSTSICASLSAAGTYCPAMAFNAGDPTRSAPTGCNSVTQITQTVQSKAVELVANGPITLPGLVKLGEVAQDFAPPTVYLSSTGTVANVEAFADSAKESSTDGAGGSSSTSSTTSSTSQQGSTTDMTENPSTTSTLTLPTSSEAMSNSLALPFSVLALAVAMFVGFL